MQGNEIDEVSPMFISEHANTLHGMQNKCLQIVFFNNPNKFFFMIPKVCLSKCVFHFLNLKLEYLFEEIYA